MKLAADGGTGGGGVPEVTALRFGSDGLSLAVGTSAGHVFMHDMRSRTPVLTKDHQYGFPIKDLKFHDFSGNIVSADTKIVKIWDRESGAPYASIEPEDDINDVCVVPDSGLVLVAVESKDINSFYIPQLVRFVYPFVDLALLAA